MGIPRGDTRQFQNTAVKNENAARVVASAVAQVGSQLLQITEAANAAKVADLSSQSNIEIQNLNREFRLKYSNDPTNKQGLEELDNAVNNVFQKNSAQIPITSKRAWANSVKRIKDNLKIQNVGWIAKQQASNALTDTESVMKNTLKQSEESGKNNDIDGALLNVDNIFDELKVVLDQTVGTAEADKMLAEFKEDNFKAFIAGQIVSDPYTAIETINSQKGDQFLTVTEQDKLSNLAINQMQTKFIQGKLETIQSEINAIPALYEKAKSGTMTIGDLESIQDEVSAITFKYLAKHSGYGTFYDTEGQPQIIKRKEKRGKVVTEDNKIQTMTGLTTTGMELLTGDYSLNTNDEDKKKELIAENLFGVSKEGEFKPVYMGKVDLEEKADIKARSAQLTAYMDKIKVYSAKIQDARSKGLISKTDMVDLYDQFVTPSNEYLYQNAKQLGKGGSWFTSAVGIGAVKEYNKKIFREASGAKAKKLATVEGARLSYNYITELNKYVKENEKSESDMALNNIYDLAKMSERERNTVYKQSFDKALLETKKNSVFPAFWFDAEHKKESIYINTFSGKGKADSIKNEIVEELQKNPDRPVQDVVNEKMADSVVQENQNIINEGWAF